MKLSLFIAFRYLFAKKSHNVINIISIISAVGIGIGSLALTVILSVYNGFDNLIKDLYESYEADYIITPTKGKTLLIDSTSFAKIAAIEHLAAICPTIEENVFIRYGENQSIATIKGVDTTYQNVSSLAKNIVEGEFKTQIGEVSHAIVGQKLAQDLMLRVRFLTPLEIYFPDRNQDISLINPMQNLKEETLFPSGIIRLENSFDKKLLFAPLERVRNLIGYKKNEATSIEIYLNYSSNPNLSKREKEKLYNSIGIQIQDILGEGYVVKDRFRQNETIYKMMKAEKFTVFFILFFVILIISINIFSSLVMLIIDKQHDIETFLSMGAPTKMIHQIFILQGWLIAVLGSSIGIIIGLALCFAQKLFGIIEIPGNFIVDAYPVNIQATDIIITFIGVNAIGYAIALIASKGFKRNL